MGQNLGLELEARATLLVEAEAPLDLSGEPLLSARESQLLGTTRGRYGARPVAHRRLGRRQRVEGVRVPKPAPPSELLRQRDGAFGIAERGLGRRGQEPRQVLCRALPFRPQRVGALQVEPGLADGAAVEQDGAELVAEPHAVGRRRHGSPHQGFVVGPGLHLVGRAECRGRQGREQDCDQDAGRQAGAAAQGGVRVGGAPGRGHEETDVRHVGVAVGHRLEADLEQAAHGEQGAEEPQPTHHQIRPAAEARDKPCDPDDEERCGDDRASAPGRPPGSRDAGTGWRDRRARACWRDSGEPRRSRLRPAARTEPPPRRRAPAPGRPR